MQCDIAATHKSRMNLTHFNKFSFTLSARLLVPELGASETALKSPKKMESVA